MLRLKKKLIVTQHTFTAYIKHIQFKKISPILLISNNKEKSTLNKASLTQTTCFVLRLFTEVSIFTKTSQQLLNSKQDNSKCDHGSTVRMRTGKLS